MVLKTGKQSQAQLKYFPRLLEYLMLFSRSHWTSFTDFYFAPSELEIKRVLTGHLTNISNTHTLTQWHFCIPLSETPGIVKKGENESECWTAETQTSIYRDHAIVLHQHFLGLVFTSVINHASGFGWIFQPFCTLIHIFAGYNYLFIFVNFLKDSDAVSHKFGNYCLLNEIGRTKVLCFLHKKHSFLFLPKQE